MFPFPHRDLHTYPFRYSLQRAMSTSSSPYSFLLFKDIHIWYVWKHGEWGNVFVFFCILSTFKNMCIPISREKKFFFTYSSLFFTIFTIFLRLHYAFVFGLGFKREQSLVSADMHSIHSRTHSFNTSFSLSVIFPFSLSIELFCLFILMCA